jgi:enoyl-CoA hydratase
MKGSIAWATLMRSSEDDLGSLMMPNKNSKRPPLSPSRNGSVRAKLGETLCGMAKAKYHLLCEPVTGEEAERIGLVSLAVPAEELQARALDVAVRLAEGAPNAIRWTKYALNNWLRAAGPIFDASLGLELLGFSGPELPECTAALREKRSPRFPPDGIA